MKNPEQVFRELGQLYDFYREIAKFRFKETEKAVHVPNERTTVTLKKSRQGQDVVQHQSLDETFESWKK